AAGADGAAGQHLLPAGAQLGAGRCAALLAAGIADVPVRRPRIHLVAAKADASAPIAGALAVLAGDIGREGGEAIAGAGPLDEILAAPAADAVVAVGGTGSGRDDNAVSVLARAGTVAAHGIGISPGETAAFGRVRAAPVLLLPGRLDSALAAWMTIGRPLLGQLAGAAPTERAWPATLSRKVASSIGLAEIVPVRCRDGKAEPLASGYWPLQALAQADGWILIAADSEGHPAGTPVAVRALP
ncbi:MAG: molybdopterin-binding protein, partial [Pseudorhodoplanes sp.]